MVGKIFDRKILANTVWARLSTHHIVGQNFVSIVGTFSNRNVLKAPSDTANIGRCNWISQNGFIGYLVFVIINKYELRFSDTVRLIDNIIIGTEDQQKLKLTKCCKFCSYDSCKKLGWSILELEFKYFFRSGKTIVLFVNIYGFS